MSGPYALTISEINELRIDEFNKKYKYCPDYDLLLYNNQGQLIQKQIEHLKDRQQAIAICVNEKTIPIIQTLCQQFPNITFDVSGAPSFTVSKLINNIRPLINELMFEWKGPGISDNYKNKFNDPNKRKTMNTKELFSNPIKFKKNARDYWSRSSSKIKVEGEFFIIIIEEIESYIQICCKQIRGALATESKYIMDSAWYGIIYELLRTTLKFERTKKKSVFRNAVVKDYKRLHKKLGIVKFVEDFKLIAAQLEENKKKKENQIENGKKVKRIEKAEIFGEKLREHFKEKRDSQTYHSYNDQVSVTSSPSTPSTNYIHYGNNNNNNENMVVNGAMDASAINSTYYNQLLPMVPIDTNYSYNNVPMPANHNRYNNMNTMYYEPIHYGGYNSGLMRYHPYNSSNSMITNGINYNNNNSNTFANSAFNYECANNENYYGYYNENAVAGLPVSYERTNTYYNPSIGTNYSQNSLVNTVCNENSVFNDGYTNYYGNYNIVGDGVQ